MRKILSDILLKLANHLQFIPVKLYSPHIFKYKTGKYPIYIQEHELKILSSFLGRVNNQKYYNKLLSTYVPTWDITILKGYFVGFGMGGASLDTFRKVITESHTLFEKVYFTNHKDFKTIKWFQNYIYPLLQEYITVPIIDLFFEGELVTVTYAQFYDLIEETEENQEKKSIYFNKVLYEVSKNKLQFINYESAPGNVSDFTSHFEYTRGIDFAKKELNTVGIKVDGFIDAAIRSKSIITHGDIQTTNIYKNNTLIDWDSFGIYPLGMDPAFTYYRLLLNNKITKTPDSWIEDNFRPSIDESDWECFSRNYHFFLYVFAAKTLKLEKHKAIELRIIEHMKRYNLTL